MRNRRIEVLETLIHNGGTDVRDRIERLYLPVYEWCTRQLDRSLPVVFGVNGPQGAGKSTLTHLLCELFEREGRRAITVSVDDFYLTRGEQVRLAGENPDNPYLHNRGSPGTHDLELGTRILRQLRAARGTVRIPVYEKSLFSGKGDRLDFFAWILSPSPAQFGGQGSTKGWRWPYTKIRRSKDLRKPKE